MTDVKIGLCGLGSIGKAAARLLIDHRSGIDVVAAITKDPADIGRPLGEVAASSAPHDLVVGEDLDALLATRPDLVLFATGSFLARTTDDIVKVAAAGADLISPCEELAFPFTRDAEAARRIDQAARTAGATVLGTGVNPGFMFDSFLAAASGCSWDVAGVTGRRVVDVAGFGQNIHRRLGIGYTAEEFEAGHADGTIAGHVGFPESVALIAERFGWTLDGPVVETFEPMVARTDAPSNYGGVPAGRTEGFVQRAVGTVEGRPMVRLELILHLRPAAEGLAAEDTFSIGGVHPVQVTISPGMDAIPATAAQLVNSIPAVLGAAPGLRTVNDLPAAAAWTQLEAVVRR
ncbi:4-hydroxy-tetrahydrodipicolinate reductase [Kribbella amoyensis]|uniref:4-hydroxy-tetrahydrodipicolinate reductase n=1 Tax=Kribbella amoyensis TaxID=996641 RepID=A0A561B8L2_9ACTN|nr:NADP-binding protein [Kribbella amoyensis]TWD75098.1 4-hydroxy-tetrahydrodipicolinate reductase [Kribbella amoyensis]